MIIVETVSHEYHIPSAVVSIASTMQTFPFSWKVLVPRLAINQNIHSIYITPERSLSYRFWLRGGLDVFPQHSRHLARQFLLWIQPQCSNMQIPFKRRGRTAYSPRMSLISWYSLESWALTPRHGISCVLKIEELQVLQDNCKTRRDYWRSTQTAESRLIEFLVKR